MKGRKPKPPALALIEGNPGRRKIRAAPKPPEGMPLAPAYIEGYALEEWQRGVGGLYAMGVIAEIDQTMLASYCLMYQRWRDAENEIAKSGMTETTKNGNTVQHPAVGIANTSFQNMLKVAEQYGLTASARARLAIGTDTQKKSKFEGLIGGKK